MACGQQTTECGVTPDSSWLQALERRAVARWPDACAALDGWTVRVHDTATWVDPWGRRVAGLTYCTARRIDVGNDLASYAHEVAHARECPAENSEHVGWQQVYRDIEAIQSTGDRQ